MRRFLRNHQLVMVEWVDSFQLEAGWHWVDDLKRRKPSLCYSVGWVLHDNADVICLAETISKVGDGIQVSGVVSIPVKAIVKKKNLSTSFSCPDAA